MPTWKLVLEYDGTDFAGWQVQPRERTVQGELKRALEVVLREEVRVTGAGRTDAGVHALGQVASVTCRGDVVAALRSVNAVLAEDVVARSASAAPEGFDARRSALRRHYRYVVHRGPTALQRRFCLALDRLPDPARMNDAASRLLGRRDFMSFASGLEPGDGTECIVERAEVRERGDFLDFEVTANRFLRKMVRTVMGTLLEVGWGQRPPEWIDDVVAARDRRAAGTVVPPTGLFLVAVDYPDIGPDGR